MIWRLRAEETFTSCPHVGRRLRSSVEAKTDGRLHRSEATAVLRLLPKRLAPAPLVLGGEGCPPHSLPLLPCICILSALGPRIGFPGALLNVLILAIVFVVVVEAKRWGKVDGLTSGGLTKA
jgi:hypothetical protein